MYRSAPLDSVWLNSESAVARLGEIMIAIGIILLIIGFVTKIAIVWTIGIIVLVLGPHSLANGHDRSRHRRTATLLVR